MPPQSHLGGRVPAGAAEGLPPCSSPEPSVPRGWEGGQAPFRAPCLLTLRPPPFFQIAFEHGSWGCPAAGSYSPVSSSPLRTGPRVLTFPLQLVQNQSYSFDPHRV